MVKIQFLVQRKPDTMGYIDPMNTDIKGVGRMSVKRRNEADGRCLGFSK